MEPILMPTETRLSATQMNMVIAAILASGTMSPNASADQVVSKYRKVILALRPPKPTEYVPSDYKPSVQD